MQLSFIHSIPVHPLSNPWMHQYCERISYESSGYSKSGASLKYMRHVRKGIEVERISEVSEIAKYIFQTII